MRDLFGILRAKLRARAGGCPVAVFHDFVPPPVGGGHQFMRALVAELRRQGVGVEINAVGRDTRAVLFNSFNFRPRLLRACRRPGLRCVHRLDGPMLTYRGFDDGTDAIVEGINREFAHLSVFQSEFSRQAHLEAGLDVKPGPIIGNAADPAIFLPRGDRPINGRLKVFASSWSDNPNKGADVFEWLESHGAGDGVDLMFMGRCPVPLRRIRHLPPGDSGTVARTLRGQDVFLAASQNDPCSNSVIEALTVGLPVLFRESGGHPELVGEGGIGFRDPAELPGLFQRIRDEYAYRRSRIEVGTIRGIAGAYRDILLGERD